MGHSVPLIEGGRTVRKPPLAGLMRGGWAGPLAFGPGGHARPGPSLGVRRFGIVHSTPHLRDSERGNPPRPIERTFARVLPASSP